MIKHIVFFKFLTNKRESNLDIFIGKLKELPDRIEYIRSYEIGSDILKGPNSYDVALVSTFDTIEDLMSYKVHPDHEAFAEYMKTVCEPIKVVDFEI